jgi:hypothetical protein
MPADSEKQQIGIRLPAETVRAIDQLRGTRTRAEFCRELIEIGVTGTQSPSNELMQMIVESLAVLQDQSGKSYQATVLNHHDIGKTIEILEHFQSAMATAVVGVLTKIGQVVRQEDQRIFAREHAEQFVARIFYPDNSLEDDMQ